MHPILQRRMRLVLYLAAWSPALALLAYVARANGETSWPRAMALLAPACLVFAFVALSPWNLCRVQPLRFGEWAGLAATWASASLGLGDRESIPLHEELALAHNYLDVEQVRFGERLKVNDEIQPGCEECAIPALLLQPLVENAVKHGVAGMIEGGTIRLAVSRAD